MRVIARPALLKFSARFPDSKGALNSWWLEAKKAAWEKPQDIKAKYGSASILTDNRVVFNVCGNKYRLIVKIHYNTGIIFIRFIGTHEEYDKIDAEVV